MPAQKKFLNQRCFKEQYNITEYKQLKIKEDYYGKWSILIKVTHQ